MGLIAKVMVVAMVDGKRVEFQPGEELPELHEHDVAALKAMGAIEDTAETARAEKKAAAAEKQTQADFDRARKQVQAAAESTATGAEAEAAGEPAKAAKASGAKKAAGTAAT